MSSKKRRRSDSYSSDEEDASSDSDSASEESSEDERRSSKHRRDSRDGKSEKKKKKKKHRSKKHKKEKHKKKRRESANVEQISHLDYFRKSKEFRVWLKEERGIFFDEFTSEQAREKFRSFVKRWNRGELKEKYYKDMDSARIESGDRTSYKWKFLGMDKVETGSVGDQVNAWTQKETVGPMPGDGMIAPSSTAHLQRPQPVVGPMLPPGLRQSVDSDEEEDRRREERYQAARKRKQHQEYDKMVLDELLPKATGHEARIEKRKAAAERKRSRAESPEMSDSRLLGSGGDIHKKIAQRRQAREEARDLKQQRARSKLEEYREKEQARMAELKAMAMANRSEGALWKRSS